MAAVLLCMKRVDIFRNHNYQTINNPDLQIKNHRIQHLGMMAPSSDDLIFLLSLVGSPNSVISEEENQQQKKKAAPKSGSVTSSWKQTLTSLPRLRRDIILVLQTLAIARQKYNNSSSSKATAKGDDDNIIEIRLQTEVSILEEVESAASTIRTCSAEYIQSIDGYKKALQQFWRKQTHNQLEKIGYQLSTQLICQLDWDERLSNAILTFLNDELYQKQGTKITSSNEKLQIWSDALSKMLKIDKSLWDFVEREVYDETLLDLDEDEAPAFLNGERSTQYITVNLGKRQSEGSREEYSSVQENANINQIDSSLHAEIVSSASLDEAVEAFVQNKSAERNSRSITSVLLVGEEGCGKTHLLNTIQQQYIASSSGDKSVKIIRPNYQVDLVGNSIGSTEDRLIALFTYATNFISNGRRCIIMLDDIDRMFSLSNDLTFDSSDASDMGNGAQYYVGRRCKSLFITILDTLRERQDNTGHLLLLCTSRLNCGEVIDRFDRTYRRGQPDDKQRYQIITSCLSPVKDNVVEKSHVDDIEKLLSLIVHHSAGRSTFELAQFCREAILRCAEESSVSSNEQSSTILKHRLQCLDKMLQTKAPQSVRSGSLDGIVDMRVFTPEELQSKLTLDTNGEIQMPLLGADAERAHEALMNVVITPLCRSDKIRELLYGGRGDKRAAFDVKPIRVGALLAGAPGVGKTELAYHCAALAAKMSRVSLLDVSCTSLIHKEMGGSERAVQKLFTAVRAAAPCIVLLDGIESVAVKRGNDNTSEGTMDRVLSTFLTEMDGIETGGSDGASGNVAIIGITHNPDLIDPSLLRPGRLEKVITLGTPDYEARKVLVSRQIQDIDFDFTPAGYFDAKTKDDVSDFVAMSAAGLSAVEVIAICKEASMVCLRELNFETTKKPLLTYDHFKSAVSIMKGKSQSN